MKLRRFFLVAVAAVGLAGGAAAQDIRVNYTMDSTSSPEPDEAGGDNDGVFNGDVSGGASGEFGDALSFDGSGDYLQANPTVDSGSFTVCVNAKSSSSSDIDYISQMNGLGGFANRWIINFQNGNLQFNIDDGSNNVEARASGGLGVRDGNYHYICGVRDTSEGQAELYVDGSQEVTTSDDTSNDLGTTGDLFIGKFSGDDFQGDIDEVEIFASALSQSQIQSLDSDSTLGSGGSSNSAPTLSNPSPVDGAEGVNQPVELSLFVTDGDNSTIQTVEAYYANNTLIESFSNVQNASFVNTTVSGIRGGEGFEWYYEANDGANTVKSSTFNFTTAFKERGEFSLVSLPDTQIYSQDYPKVFTSQTSWIADVENKIDIRHVLHVGDIVNNGDNDIPQWDNANNSLSYLFNGSTSDSLGVSLAIGNHDYDDEASTRAATTYNNYFGVNRFQNNDWFGGVKDAGAMENSYSFFNASGDQYGVIKLEFCPSDSTLSWANQTVSNYPDTNWIYLTHTLIDDHGTFHEDSEDAGCANYGVSGNDGDDQFRQFIRYHENLLFSVNGHVPYEPFATNGTLTKQGVNGNTIHMFHMDYQSPPGPLPNGGDGWLRRMNFYPDQDIMEMQAYTPYQDEYNTTSIEEFNVTLDYVENINPAASLSANTTDIQTGETVLLDASGSTDSDGSITQFDYDVDGDGTFEKTAAGQTLENKYTSTGSFDATVRVTDDDGATDTASIVVDVGSPPTASITANATSINTSQTVEFDASGSTDSDGTISSTAFDLDNDGTFETSGTTALKQFTNTGDFTITGQVTDNDGLKDTDSLTISVTDTTSNNTTSNNTTTTTTTVNASGGQIVQAFAVVAFAFAFLAVKTPDKQGGLQILNYLMFFLTVFFLGYLAIATVDSGTSILDVLTPWVNSFYAPLALVFAYFAIMMLSKVLEEFDSLDL